jgi:hypothetical protein
MFRTSKQIMRIAILLMLFQFISPAFIPSTALEVSNERITTVHVQHSSIVAPMFLKENEEKENSEFLSVSESAPLLLDLTIHGLNLTASHRNKYSTFPHLASSPELPLFTLFCSFLI